MQWRDLTTKNDYVITRESKIANYRRVQVLKEEVTHRKTQENIKEYYTALFESYQYECLTQVQFNKEEIKMLKFRQEMQQDEKVKESYDSRNKNLPKLSSVTIPKEDPVQRIDSRQIVQQGQQEGGSMCGDCMKFGNRDLVGMNDQVIRQELKERVFQPGHSVPTMTLDSFADGEIEFMNQQEALKKQNEEEALRNPVDEDKEEFNEEKTRNDRAWEDWKDDNEKGGGNKMR